MCRKRIRNSRIEKRRQPLRNYQSHRQTRRQPRRQVLRHNGLLERSQDTLRLLGHQNQHRQHNPHHPLPQRGHPRICGRPRRDKEIRSRVGQQRSYGCHRQQNPRHYID